MLGNKTSDQIRMKVDLAPRSPAPTFPVRFDRLDPCSLQGNPVSQFAESHGLSTYSPGSRCSNLFDLKRGYYTLYLRTSRTKCLRYDCECYSCSSPHDLAESQYKQYNRSYLVPKPSMTKAVRGMNISRDSVDLCSSFLSPLCISTSAR